MIEGLDFAYLYPQDDPQSVHVKLLVGPYKDTVYKYGKVAFKEESDGVHLIFAYDVLESTISKPRKLEKDEKFKNYIGDLLVEIMSGNLDQDIIDESRTNDSQESNLQ